MSGLPPVSDLKARTYYKLYFFLPAELGVGELGGLKGQWESATFPAGAIYPGANELTFDQMVEYHEQLRARGYSTRAYRYRVIQEVLFMPDETVESAVAHNRNLRAGE